MTTEENDYTDAPVSRKFGQSPIEFFRDDAERIWGLVIKWSTMCAEFERKYNREAAVAQKMRCRLLRIEAELVRPD